MQGKLTKRIEHMLQDLVPLFDSNDTNVLSRKIEDDYQTVDNIRFIRISRDDGKILYISGAPLDGAYVPQAIPLSDDHTDEIFYRTVNIGQNDHMLIVTSNTTKNGVGYIIETGTYMGSVDHALQKLVGTLIIGLPIVIILAAGGGFFLVRRAMQPVENIRATAEKITSSNLSQRLPVLPTKDALENLSLTLNQMLERLELAYQQASRFSADASHELRTPLAIMRSEMESLLNESGLPPAARERVGSILEEIERLSGIVEGLFAIARLDAGEGKVAHEELDLAELVRTTVEQMQLLAVEKSLSITIDAPSSIYVMGDKARLKQVIVNLFDNAIKYTLSGGAISLSVSTDTSKAIFSVVDNGIGISPEAIPFVFERFYRTDKVRARTSQGAGLGLSIVRAICQAHNGTIDIKSVEGSGTTVTVLLPGTKIKSLEHTHVSAEV